MDSQLFNKPGVTVRTDKLRKSYRSGEDAYTALHSLTCEIPAGQVTVIQGPSGCGKTTLLNIVGGVDFADSGTVTVGDVELTRQRDERKLARYRLNDVGFVFQSFNLIPGLTVDANLQLPMAVAGLPHDLRKAKAEQLLELVGIADKRGKRPEQLSGGEQQRVAIALSLVNDPPVILADEPTGNLDSKNTGTVVGLLRMLAHEWKKTIIVSTHDPLVADQGDQILVMRDGSIEGQANGHRPSF